jgi:hypothetical protein
VLQIIGSDALLAAIAAAIKSALVSGAEASVHFVTLLAYFVPLTLASSALVFMLSREIHPLLKLVLSAGILGILAVTVSIQRHLLGGHLTIGHPLCSISNSTTTSCSGYLKLADYVVGVAEAYWHAFGPVAFIGSVLVGGLVGGFLGLFVDDGR